jgi:MarR-like DNA-binding transcriptional regulator SgrR of sgrS sRNA
VALAVGGALTSIAPAPLTAYRLPRYGGDLVGALPSRPVTLDPVRMERLGEWQLAQMLYDGLTRLQRQGQPPQLHLARSLQAQGAARRRVRITLRAGLRAHGGRRLTAADAVASLRRLAAGPQGWLLAAVRRIRRLDDQRLALRLRRPCPELSAVLAAPPAAILPGGRPPGASPDGTGAFRLVRGRPGLRVRLSAYARHFAGRPFVDTVTLVPYRRRRDEISAFYIGRSVVSFQGKRMFGREPQFATRRSRSPALTTVALLVGRSGPATHRRVRQALYLAVNKQRLRQLVTGAPTRPAHGPVPPVLLGGRARRRARRPAPHSVARATALLAAAATHPAVAAARQPNGDLALTLLVDRSRHRDMDAARKIMADLAAVKVRVTIRRVSARTLRQRRARGRFELALHRFTSPVLRSRYHLAAAWAAARRPRTAKRIVRARRARLSRRVRAFMRELPLIPLYHVGLRVEISARVPVLRQGPWGLLDWADARLPSPPPR